MHSSPRADALRRALAAAALVVAARGAGAQSAAGVVAGVVRDARTGAPLGAADVRLGARTAVTRDDGVFRFAMVARGRVRLTVRRLGYAPADVDVGAGSDSTWLEVRLSPAALLLDRVVVTTPGGDRAAGGLASAATVLEGAQLDRALAGSLAATVAAEPGVAMRYNGPLAAAPVIRGLSGDRVLVLEDGQRTGDIATTAPDHAITIDPMAARRIEVVRGPAGLLFGSNVLGGVLNVVREDVPRERPERPTGHVGVQGESVNAGAVAGGGLTLPAGPFALRLTGTARTAGDTRTPDGALPFTDLDGFDAGIGASVAGARGHAGVAAREVRSFYGVPSSFGGRTLPGAHDGGVYVDLRRSTARVEGEWRRVADRGGVTGAGLALQGVRFEQEEFERGGFVGTRFGQLAASGDVVVRHRRRRAIPWIGGSATGALGAWGQWRDFRAEGSQTGTRPAEQWAGALYGYEEWTLGRVRASGGVRVDRVRVRPLDRTETALLRGVRERRMGALTGALTVALDVAPGASVGATAARAFRPPAVEELFSAGPHLASYAYEVGNPALRPERGSGGELFARLARAGLAIEASAYVMEVRDFVLQAPVLDPGTGTPMLDPRLRRYVVYRQAQGDARLAGAEGRAQWEPRRGWVLDATASVVRGTLRTMRLDPGDALLPLAAGAPLPAMPPARARVAVRRDVPRWFAGLALEGAARQGRVPPSAGVEGACREGEGALRPAELCATAGWTQLHATGGLRWMLGGRLHALTLAVDNVADASWRDHLWRAKQVAPQPGRNARLLYRVSW